MCPIWVSFTVEKTTIDKDFQIQKKGRNGAARFHIVTAFNDDDGIWYFVWGTSHAGGGAAICICSGWPYEESRTDGHQPTMESIHLLGFLPARHSFIVSTQQTCLPISMEELVDVFHSETNYWVHRCFRLFWCTFETTQIMFYSTCYYY